MKPTRWSFSLAVCLFCFTHAASGADDDAEHAALRSMKTNYEHAVNSGDLSKLAGLIKPDTTGVMVTGEGVKGLSEMEAYWKKIQDLIGPGGSYQVTLKPDRSELFGDFALAHGSTEDVVRLPNGKQLHFTSLWTAVCRKEDGQWKLLRMQATMDPVNNVFTGMKLKAAKFTFGGVGLLAGLVLGFLFGQILRRSRGRAQPTPQA